MIAVIKRNIDAEFSSRKKKAFRARILAYDTCEGRPLNAIGDRLPGGSVVLRSKNIRSLIVEPMTIDGDIRFSDIEMGSFDHGDSAPFGDCLRSHIFPGFASVARHMNQTSIA